VKLLEREEEQQVPARRLLLRDDTKFASGKIAFFQYLAVAVFLFLVAGFWELQIRNPEIYYERAEQNRIKSIPVLAPRGKILDRDGRVIVDNHSSYSLILSRENLKEEHLKTIADGLNIEYDALVARIRKFQSRPKYEPIIIKEELTPGELAFVEAHRDPDTFPEMELIRAQRRLYPKDGTAAHAIGYVGEISEAELNTPELAKYHQGDVIGKDGIEKQYNETLMGVDGLRRVEVDNLGRERRPMEMKEAIPGKNLELTLDLDLQVVAELAMENRRGAVVALDPRSGEILALVSRPAFDPNLFASRIRTRDWKDLLSNPEHPLLNRAIQAQLAPGSTFKPLMALAGLETGVIDDNFRAHCGGGQSFYGRYFRCHSTHGVVDVHKGIVQSCDVFFYNVGNKLGIDRIAQYAELAGFGHKTGVDLPHEAEGVMPSTRWKARNYRQKWYAGETISVSIGQGAVAVTPLQLAVAIGGIAAGGVWRQPHVVREPAHMAPARRGEVNLDNIQKVIAGMYGVVNEGGTGGRAKLPGLNVCGKTGTAQLASNDMLKGTKLGRTMKDNAWFVGFAPREAPEIVVVALFEGGEHGPMAAPIVRDVLKAYFDKKVRMGLMQPQIAAAPNPMALLTPPGAH
jgi:penicillin-binding protein 2